MFKKYFLIPVILTCLAAVYSIICFLIFFTKGKNRLLIKRKLKIGSLIIAMQTLLISPVFVREEPEVLCYIVAAEPSVEIY